ncbi:MAG: TonB-dependent receptor [Saprospiraceae bacterium]|jgi:TonB-linked SusC/RagA family outer membrane protein|nr:TonB-dependent receptor [Saprospiraceae bacterium]
MKRKHLSKLRGVPNLLKTVGISFFFLLVFGSSASAQTMTVSGKVTDETGLPLPGVSILVLGTTTGTVTETDGSYELRVEKGATLQFSFTGYNSYTVVVGDNGKIDHAMEPSTTALSEVVVTGYSTQRKRDITGAVAVVDADELNELAATSFIQKLEGRAAGVTVSTSGEPGEGSVIRIRGISSFQNNDPLYVIDGVPVEDSYSTNFNPNDIESIQVLKDASSASIYGSRANNGVVIVTTKKGKAGKTRVTYDAYVGRQSPINEPDYLITNPLDYSDYVWSKYENAGKVVDPSNPYGQGRGKLPTYTFPAGNTADESSYSYPDNIIVKANPGGTYWFDEVFAPSYLTEHNIGVSGGNENGRYYFSTSYTDNKGTMLNNYFKRMSVRANTEFNVGKRIVLGENLQLSRIRSLGNDGVSGGNQDEQGVMTWVTLMNPLTPVYDVGGNYAGDKAPGMSNGSNPLAALTRAKDNVGTFHRVLGNTYAELAIIDGLKARTSFGVDYYQNHTGGFNFPNFENREFSSSNGWGEDWSTGLTWTWTNTLAYNKNFGSHALGVMVGYEAIKGNYRNIGGSLANYFSTNINGWYLNTGLADPGSRVVYSGGFTAALASAFGKLDYAFNDKYLISATIRRDGSSNFGNEKYGVFPAISVGWRVSGESFMKELDWISDLKLRFGWGVTGNQRVPGGNAFDRFGGGPSSTFYDIAGQQNTVTTGYALTNRGNANTKWEENVSTNAGLDLSILDGKFNLVVDVYKRTVDGLLFPAALPGTAGTAAPAFVNIGKMENKGFDIGLDYKAKVNADLSFDLGLTFSRYQNEIISIDGSSEAFFSSGFDSRIGLVNINQLGYAISSFYGFTADGIFQSDADVEAHAVQDGAAPGRLRFKDIDGFDDDGVRTGAPDGKIDDADKGVIGSPHPDFVGGINLGINFKNFDVSIFLFTSVGNEIFQYNKLFDTFGLFNSNVRKSVLTDSWSETNTGGSIPKLDIDDTFSQVPSSFYVEDASYLRLKNLSIGYTFPKVGNVFSSLRLYLQAQNLFTFTGYSGLDPAPSNFGVQDGLNADQWNGFDFGNYPANKIWMFGLNAAF